VKGKGILGVEGRPDWHGKPLQPEQAEAAIRELESHLHHVPQPPVRRPTTTAVTWPTSTATALGPPPAAATIATREAYGNALVRVGAADLRIVALDGDVKNSTYAERFRKAYPERFFEAWIAEQNMVSMAAGLAAQALIPFVSTFAFPERAADQIRLAGISRTTSSSAARTPASASVRTGPRRWGSSTWHSSGRFRSPSSSIRPTRSRRTPACSLPPTIAASSTSGPRGWPHRRSTAPTKPPASTAA